MKKREFMRNAPTVFTKDGMHQIVLPGGEELPSIFKTTVIDVAPERDYPIVKAEMLCNLASTKEEALKLYEEAEKRWNEMLKK